MFVRINNGDDFIDVSPEVASRLAEQRLVVRNPQDGNVGAAPGVVWSWLLRKVAVEMN